GGTVPVRAPRPLRPLVHASEPGQGPGELQPRARVPVRRDESGRALQRHPGGARHEQRGPRVPPRSPPAGRPPAVPPGGNVPPVLYGGHPTATALGERDYRGAAARAEGDPRDARDHAEGAGAIPRAPPVDPRLPDRAAHRDGDNCGEQDGAKGPVLREEARGLTRTPRSKSPGAFAPL